MDHISLRFAGNGVAPDNTRCKELAAIIEATEDLIIAMMGEAEEGEEEPLPLCLVQIEDKSLGLKYASLQIATVMMLWQNVAVIINTGRFEKMIPKARQSLVAISNFVKKKGCTAYVEDSRRGVLASFDYTLSIPAEQKFKGKSSLIGEVIRVGGKDPVVRLKLPSGAVISCDTSESIAKELGHRLYDVVTCKGMATWDYMTGDVLDFKIESVGAFVKVSASEAFKSLAEAMPSAVAKWNSAVQAT